MRSLFADGSICTRKPQNKPGLRRGTGGKQQEQGEGMLAMPKTGWQLRDGKESSSCWNSTVFQLMPVGGATRICDSSSKILPINCGLLVQPQAWRAILGIPSLAQCNLNCTAGHRAEFNPTTTSWHRREHSLNHQGTWYPFLFSWDNFQQTHSPPIAMPL